jgi:3-mercaptopyruvate sulfurtransferase SseA
MNLISREELKEKLDRGDDFKLAMVLGDWQFRAKHIPGSLNIHTLEIAWKLLQPDDEIVIY